MTIRLNKNLREALEKNLKELGSAVSITIHEGPPPSLNMAPGTILASITLAASDFPQADDEFCDGDDDCECGCGEFDGVDLDAESEAYVKAMKSQLPDASEFMKQALSGELFGFPPYDAEKERAKQVAYNEALTRHMGEHQAWLNDPVNMERMSALNKAFQQNQPPRQYFFYGDPMSDVFQQYQGFWVDPSRTAYPKAIGYGAGGYFDTASGTWVKPSDPQMQMRVHDLYISKDGKTEIAIASNYPPGTIIQSLVGNWFKSDGTMWNVTSERPTEPVEIKAAYSGPIAGDVDAIADKLKSIEPKYVTPKPPAEKLDVWAKGTARRNDGWLWRWSGAEWKKEGPAF